MKLTQRVPTTTRPIKRGSPIKLITVTKELWFHPSWSRSNCLGDALQLAPSIDAILILGMTTRYTCHLWIPLASPMITWKRGFNDVASFTHDPLS
ncbi:hypothetical protein AAMO2058_001036900 [Amorphochlora amoebiformis]